MVTAPFAKGHVPILLGSVVLFGVLGPAPAQALTTFTLSSNPTNTTTPFVANAPGDPTFTMTLQNPVLGSPVNTPNLVSNPNGLCIFANAVPQVACDATAGSQLNGLSFQFSKSVYLKSFVIGGASSAIPGSQFSTVFSQGSNNIGTFNFTAPAGSFVGVTQSFNPQGQSLLIPANTLVTLSTNGTGLSTTASSNLLIRSFTVDTANGAVAVPAPLPLVGAGAAFGWSRRLRRRLRQRTV